MDSKKLFTEEELVKYYTCVMEENKPFTKTYYLKVPEKLVKSLEKVPVVLRTKRAIELDKVNEILVNAGKSKQTDFEISQKISQVNLAYSLVSFGEEKYDKGDLPERLSRLENLQTPKLNLIWEFCGEFEKLVEAMSKELQTF